jgi:hypothetical protein
MATAETVSRVWKMLTRAYPDHANKHLAGAEAVETMRLYQRILADIPDNLLEAATVDHIAGSQWFPKPSELRERCGALRFAKLDRLTPTEAWGVAKQCAISHRFASGDPIIDKVMTALGWRDFCTSDVDDESSWRARFISGYEQMTEREYKRATEHPAVTEARLSIAARRELEELTDGRDSAG